MARAKSPARPRTGVSAARPAVGSRRRPSQGDWLHEHVLQWHNLGIAVLVLSILLLRPWLALFGALGELRDAMVRALGFEIFVLIAGLVVIGFLFLLGRFALTLRGLKWAGGLGSFATGFWGLLGLARPDTLLAGVSLHGMTAGGTVGSWLVRTPLGFVMWVVAWVSGFAIFWPHGTVKAARAIPPAIAAFWNLDLHGKLWSGLVAVSRNLKVREEQVVVPVEPAAVPVATAVAPDADEYVAEDRIPRATVTVPPILQVHEAPSPAVRRTSPWQLPPLGILAPPDAERAAPDDGVRKKLIVDTLASFGVDSRVVQVNQGPTVTQFGVEPGWEVKTRTSPEKDAHGKPVLDKDGNPRFKTQEISRTRVRVNQITSLANDLALALAAPSIRIEAPVPGKPVVGIEVPNMTASVVGLRSVMEAVPFKKLSERSKLALALGQGVSGEPVAADLARMPHLLIAGATGAGKSVCINALIACILAHASPDEVRFIMIDPKRVELSAFGHIPHLALSKVIVDVEEVVGTLGAVIREMEARYKKFEQLGVRNLEAYNKHVKVVTKLPFWVVIIDELADLMMAVPFEVERQICRLAQLARATGIHLVVATQRPSVDVVTGLIKANFPTRIAFAVSSQVDSRTILDTVGAEKLLGRGDMLFLATDAAKPRRLQGVYVSDQEIERLVEFWTNERWDAVRPQTYDFLVEEAKRDLEREEQTEDPLLEKATELAQEHSRVSVSMLQRRLRIGYPRAARLMDELEEAGIVGVAEGGQSREVLSATAEEG